MSKCICAQAVRRCPCHAHIPSLGVEVVHLTSWQDYVSASAQWAPNGELIAAVGDALRCSNLMAAGTMHGDARLQLFSVAQGRSWELRLPLNAPEHVCWAPDSRVLLCISDRTAAFVEASTSAVWTQHLDVPGMVTDMTWGSASLVALACQVHHGGLITVCSAAGWPRVRLQRLRSLHAGQAVQGLACSPSGLLCCWVDHGSQLLLQGAMMVSQSDSAPVLVCELATGRKRCVIQLPGSTFEWHPWGAPAGVRIAWQGNSQAWWAPDALSLLLCDAEDDSDGSGLQGVRQLFF